MFGISGIHIHGTAPPSIVVGACSRALREVGRLANCHEEKSQFEVSGTTRASFWSIGTKIVITGKQESLGRCSVAIEVMPRCRLTLFDFGESFEVVTKLDATVRGAFGEVGCN